MKFVLMEKKLKEKSTKQNVVYDTDKENFFFIFELKATPKAPRQREVLF